MQTGQEIIRTLIHAHKAGQLKDRDLEQELVRVMNQQAAMFIQNHVETERKVMIRETYMQIFTALTTTPVVEEMIHHADLIPNTSGEYVTLGETKAVVQWKEYQKAVMGWRYTIFGKTADVPRYTLHKGAYVLRNSIEASNAAFERYNRMIMEEQAILQKKIEEQRAKQADLSKEQQPASFEEATPPAKVDPGQGTMHVIEPIKRREGSANNKTPRTYPESEKDHRKVVGPHPPKDARQTNGE